MSTPANTVGTVPMDPTTNEPLSGAPGGVAVPAPSPATSLLNVRVVDSDGVPAPLGGTMLMEATVDTTGVATAVSATIDVGQQAPATPGTATGVDKLTKFPAGTGYGLAFAETTITISQAGGFQPDTQLTATLRIANGADDPSTVSPAWAAGGYLLPATVESISFTILAPLPSGPSTNIKLWLDTSINTDAVGAAVVTSASVHPTLGARAYSN